MKNYHKQDVGAAVKVEKLFVWIPVWSYSEYTVAVLALQSPK